MSIEASSMTLARFFRGSQKLDCILLLAIQENNKKKHKGKKEDNEDKWTHAFRNEYVYGYVEWTCKGRQTSATPKMSPGGRDVQLSDRLLFSRRNITTLFSFVHVRICTLAYTRDFVYTIYLDQQFLSHFLQSD